MPVKTTHFDLLSQGLKILEWNTLLIGDGYHYSIKCLSISHQSLKKLNLIAGGRICRRKSQKNIGQRYAWRRKHTHKKYSLSCYSTNWFKNICKIIKVPSIVLKEHSFTACGDVSGQTVLECSYDMVNKIPCSPKQVYSG